MDEANAPPPTPDNREQASKKFKLTSGFLRAIPASIIGNASKNVVQKITFLPPAHWVMKEFGIRRVPPEIPATAGNRYRISLCSEPVGEPQSGKW